MSNCFYGVMSGMFFNGQYILDSGDKQGDVGMVDSRYTIALDSGASQVNRTRHVLADHSCPLGYSQHDDVCEFTICPVHSDQIADSCSCYQGYYEYEFTCVKRNDTPPPAPIIVGPSAKLIPVRERLIESPIGTILGLISGVALALLAAAIAARKCSDGLCVPVAVPVKKDTTTTAVKLHTMFSSTTNTTNETYELNSTVNRREQQVPLLATSSASHNDQYARKDEFYNVNIHFQNRKQKENNKEEK